MSTYTCWIPEYGQERGDGRTVTNAWDAEMAACLYVEQRERRSAEYPVASGETVTVAVAEGDKEPVMYSVWGEARPAYYAREVS